MTGLPRAQWTQLLSESGFQLWQNKKGKKNHNGIAIRQAVDSNEGGSQEVGKAGGQNEEKLPRMIWVQDWMMHLTAFVTLFKSLWAYQLGSRKGTHHAEGLP